MLDPDTIEKYQKILTKDPASKLFAPLADAYREKGLLEGAEALARQGIEKNPDYVTGYTVLAKILQEQKKYGESLKVLEKVLQISGENLLAYQLIAEAHTQLRDPESALKAYKMALFLNPLHEKSRKAIERLENLTAKEYESDLFEYRELQEAQPQTQPGTANSLDPVLRSLGLIDAWIVRNDLTKARELLRSSLAEYPDHAELKKRARILDVDIEKPDALKPLAPRAKQVLQKKIQILQNLLKALPQLTKRERSL